MLQDSQQLVRNTSELAEFRRFPGSFYLHKQFVEMLDSLSLNDRDGIF